MIQYFGLPPHAAENSVTISECDCNLNQLYVNYFIEQLLAKTHL